MISKAQLKIPYNLKLNHDYIILKYAIFDR